MHLIIHECLSDLLQRVDDDGGVGRQPVPGDVRPQPCAVLFWRSEDLHLAGGGLRLRTAGEHLLEPAVLHEA